MIFATSERQSWGGKIENVSLCESELSERGEIYVSLHFSTFITGRLHFTPHTE